MRAARALAAAVVLVGLTIGVPLALVTYGRLPSGNELADLPTEALTDQVVFALLTLLAWAGWAVFTLRRARVQHEAICCPGSIR
jgi:hypothetical protein